MFIYTTIKVKENGVIIKNPPEERPIRKRPDGYAGAVYEKKVFPLYSDHSIHIEDQTRCYHSTECSCIDNGEEIIYFDSAPAPSAVSLLDEIPRWHIETNQYGHYLVMDGSEDLLDNVVYALLDAEIPIIRYDNSTRLANDGHQYNWFIRLGLGGTTEECVDVITRTLSNEINRYEPVSAHTPEPEKNSLQDLEAENENLKAEIRELQFRNHFHGNYIALLQQRLEWTKKRIEELKREIQASPNQDDRVLALEKTIAEQQAKIDKQEKVFDEFANKEKDLFRDNQQLKKDCQQLREETDKLRGIKERFEKESSKLEKQNLKRKRIVRETFSRIINFKDSVCVLDPDSWDFIADTNCFPRLDKLIEEIKNLLSGNREPKNLIKFEGTKYVYKIDSHINTGNGGRGQGRIYVRKDFPEVKYALFIRVKGDDKSQREDVEFIDKIKSYQQICEI